MQQRMTYYRIICEQTFIWSFSTHWCWWETGLRLQDGPHHELHWQRWQQGSQGLWTQPEGTKDRVQSGGERSLIGLWLKLIVEACAECLRAYDQAGVLLLFVCMCASPQGQEWKAARELIGWRQQHGCCCDRPHRHDNGLLRSAGMLWRCRVEF